jgi:hypothetical protein
MRLSIDIIFNRPQIPVLFITIVEAPLSEKGIHGVDASLHYTPSTSYDIDGSPIIYTVLKVNKNVMVLREIQKGIPQMGRNCSWIFFS